MNRILVFNDDEGLLILYARELTGEGFDVLTVSDAQGLMELTEKENPDLLVMDARSCKGKGLLLLRWIRERHPTLAVILCITHPDPKFDLDLMRATHQVIKGPCLKELKQMIKTTLSRSGRFIPSIGLDKKEQPAQPWQHSLWESGADGNENLNPWGRIRNARRYP